MGNFKMPVKDFIVNLDEQCRLLEDDGTTYADGDCTPSAGGFILENFLPLILGSELQEVASTVRIRSEAAAAAVAGISTFTVSSVTASAGDVFRVVVDSVDKTPTMFQNIPIEHRYQLSAAVVDATPVAQVTTVTVTGTKGTLSLTLDGVAYTEDFATDIATTIDNWDASHTAAMAAKGITITNTATTIVFTATVAGEPFNAVTDTSTAGDMAGAVVATTPNTSGGEQIIADAIAAAINANPASLVTATAADTVVTLTAKTAGQSVAFYSGDIDGTWAVSTPAARAKNTYAHLINEDWAKNLDFDRNVEAYPEYGASYQSYYFEFNWTSKDIGGHQIPSIVPQTGRNAVRLWVNTTGASTLKTAMDSLVGDVNV